MQKQKLIVISSVLVDVIGFGIVIPILPFYVTEFGASAVIVTLLFATFSFFSFLSAPLLGAWSDRIGRRPIFLLSVASTAIGWFVFASAHSLWMLFLGRIIDGCAAGNFTTAQSYMVDLAKDEKERSANIGLIGAAFGIGFILGPLIGGALSKVSHAFPFWIAGALATTNAVSAFFFLPETHHKRDAHSPMNFNPLAPLMRAARDEKLRPLYFTWSFFAFAIVTSQTVFGLFVKDVFGFSAFQTGMMFTMVGVIVVMNQGFLLKKFWLEKFSESKLEIMMLLVLAISSLMVSTEILLLFYLSFLGSGTGQAILRVVITSQAAAAADPSKKGETMGVLSALMSAYMVIAPILSGFLYEIHHSGPYILSAVLLMLGVYFALMFKKRREKNPTSLHIA
ncbi:MAG: MFS transporter [Ignavibacteriales bacterium]|nr:MFS transporter [Ignavibacteriales bacterium]